VATESPVKQATREELEQRVAKFERQMEGLAEWVADAIYSHHGEDIMHQADLGIGDWARLAWDDDEGRGEPVDQWRYELIPDSVGLEIGYEFARDFDGGASRLRRLHEKLSDDDRDSLPKDVVARLSPEIHHGHFAGRMSVRSFCAGVAKWLDDQTAGEA
jgi:hypothetical protein